MGSDNSLTVQQQQQNDGLLNTDELRTRSDITDHEIKIPIS